MSGEVDTGYFHSEVRWNNLMRAMEGNGVITGMAVSERAAGGANMSVDVALGDYRANGTKVSKAALTNVVITAAHATLPRKDLIIADSAGNITVLDGTPLSALPVGFTGPETYRPRSADLTALKIAFAEVWVAAGVTEIYDADITDLRITVQDIYSLSTGELWLDAKDFYPSTESGAEVSAWQVSPETKEYGTNDIDVCFAAFDKDADEYVQIKLLMPPDYNGGTITAKFYWTCTGGGAAETVRWGLQARAYTDDDALDAAWGTVQVADDTWIADDDLHISAATPALTIAGSPAASLLTLFRIMRDISEDNLGVDALLLGVLITYTKA